MHRNELTTVYIMINNSSQIDIISIRLSVKRDNLNQLINHVQIIRRRSSALSSQLQHDLKSEARGEIDYRNSFILITLYLHSL